MEMLLTGERFDAGRAQEMGLVWRVVPHDELMAEARALAARLVQGAPLAQRATKEMAARGAHLPWEDALRLGESMRRVVGVDRGRGRKACRRRTNVASRTGAVGRNRARRARSRCSPARPRRPSEVWRWLVGRDVVEHVEQRSSARCSSVKGCRRRTASASIRRFSVGPGASREEVVAFEPPRHLGYVLLSGLPLRSYRADVELTPDGDGTLIAWHATLEPKLTGTGAAMEAFLRLTHQGPRPRPGPPHQPVTPRSRHAHGAHSALSVPRTGACRS